MVIYKLMMIFNLFIDLSEIGLHFINFLTNQSFITTHVLYVGIDVMDFLSVSCDECFCVSEDSANFIFDLDYLCNVFLIVALNNFNNFLLFFIKRISNLINIEIGFLHQFLIEPKVNPLQLLNFQIDILKPLSDFLIELLLSCTYFSRAPTSTGFGS